jgi:hypothetical protein
MLANATPKAITRSPSCAGACADLVDHVAQLAEAREQLRALRAPQPAATPAPLTEDEHQELVTPRAEHELHLSRWDKQPAPAAPPRSRWRRLLG